MQRRILAAAILAALVANTAGAQVRDTRGRASATATIAGTAVSDEAEPRPVRRVRVTCTSADYAASAITDDRGRFVFAGLTAGHYTIAGTKDAWVPAAYGARRPLRPGSPIPIGDGQRVDIALRMLRGSVITGVLLDYNHQPAANTVVSAMRYAMQNGTRRLAASASATTDDRGVYRIYGLPPGDYLVGAAANAAAFNAPSSELRLLDERTRAERTVAFASTYFPGTAIAAEAVNVTLGRGEERGDVDFALQLVTTARVEGTVTTTDGQLAAAGTQVNLLASSDTVFPGTASSGFRSARVGADGAFTFADVPPGAYTVIARSAAPLTWATTDLVVDGENISGISLGLQPAMTLSGVVRFDAARLKPPVDPTAIRVTLQPVESATAVALSPSGTVIDRTGRFEIAGVVPGRYRLAVSMPGLGHPGTWFARSALVRGVDALDVPIDIRAEEHIDSVVVTLSDRPAQLSGTVHNAAGGEPNAFTVILFPADAALWLPHARRIQAARPSSDGAFAFRGLPPGDYLLAAIDDVEGGEWFDPGLLQRLAARAMTLALGDGERRVQDVRLGGGDEDGAPRSLLTVSLQPVATARILRDEGTRGHHQQRDHGNARK
jgi:uncharacterized protein (DUF2141 family)